MQTFSIPCHFSGTTRPWPIYVGEPAADAHPLEAQAAWLRRGDTRGEIPQEVADSFAKLYEIALENNVSFEELCVYAMTEAETGGESTEASSDPGGVAEKVASADLPVVPKAPVPDVVAPGPGELRWDDESTSHLWHDDDADMWRRWDRAHQIWVPAS